MKLVKLCTVTAMVGALMACSGGNSQQLLETAQFEEKQNNKEHAVKLYREIVAKHPDSAQAKKAQERLSVLQ